MTWTEEIRIVNRIERLYASGRLTRPLLKRLKREFWIAAAKWVSADERYERAIKDRRNALKARLARFDEIMKTLTE